MSRWPSGRTSNPLDSQRCAMRREMFAASGNGSRVALSATYSTHIMKRRPRTSPTMGSAGQLLQPALEIIARSCGHWPSRPSSSMMRMFSSAAAQHTGWPE